MQNQIDPEKKIISKRKQEGEKSTKPSRSHPPSSQSMHGKAHGSARRHTNSLPSRGKAESAWRSTAVISGPWVLAGAGNIWSACHSTDIKRTNLLSTSG